MYIQRVLFLSLLLKRDYKNADAKLVLDAYELFFVAL